MLPPAVIGELLRHVPTITHDGRLLGCVCGWRMCDDADDRWLSFVEHLPLEQPGKLMLNAQDLDFLKRCRVKP